MNQSEITQVRDHWIEGQVDTVQDLGPEDSERLRGEERGSVNVGKGMVNYRLIRSRWWHGLKGTK